MSTPNIVAELAVAYTVTESFPTRTTEIRQGGRIVIPVEFRRALDIREGDKVQVRLENGELRITTRRAQINAAHKKFQALFPADDGRCWSEELMVERRSEAGNE